MRNLPLNRMSHGRICKPAAAVLTFTLCLAATAHSAFGQTNPPTTDPPIPGEPLHTVIPVHLDPASGDIKVGRTTYHGANPGLHLLALKRQPDPSPTLWDTADVIQDQVFTDANSVNAFLQNVLSKTKDALLIANGVGSFNIALSAIAKNLEQFGGQVDLEQFNGSLPFIFIGNGGRNKGGSLQRGGSTLPVDGYLALDSTGKNYTFIQTDYVRYDIGLDGTITVGGTAYTVANSYNLRGCSSNAFRLVVVDRISPDKMLANNTYCTAQSDGDIAQLATDAGNVINNGEGVLVFIGSAGHPIPANWSFGTDGDGRFYPLAQQIARLGGYWETMVYLTPSDTFSLVGAPPPPSFVARARSRARESSSVYPDQPTGELHGVLARGRGNWYSPLNADTSGTANLGFYDQVLAQASPQPEATFPSYASGSDQLAAFQSISTQLCGQGCNLRGQYGDINILISDYLTKLQNIKGPGGADCSQSSNSGLPFCQVWQQLSTEFQYVDGIRAFATNLGSLGTINGVNSLFDLINTWQTVQATLPPPTQPTAPSLVSPIVNLVLGLGSVAPTPLAPLFGLADTFFNFGMNLTTDPQGNQTASLATPVANLANQAQSNFNAQLSTVGTQFQLIYENWQKMQPLGKFLASGQPAWAWGASTASEISQDMTPAVRQSMYQSLMSAVYAIGSYLPNTPYNCSGNGPWPIWGQTPLWQQPNAYAVLDGDFKACGSGQTPVVQPFNTILPAYIPYTYPTDSANPSVDDPHTGTILADYSWLGISLQTSPYNSGPTGRYDPPAVGLLSTLFTPVGQTSPEGQPGLGVYRPAFFEGWPLPRVTCDPTYGTSSGNGIYIGGCNWNAAAPPLEAVPEPLTKVSIAVTNVTRTGTLVDVQLAVHNSGTKNITSIEISDLALRTLTGAHEATLIAPALPIHIDKLTPGTSASIALTLDVPQSVNKLQLTESGTAETGESSPYKFSLGQAIFPKKEK